MAIALPSEGLAPLGAGLLAHGSSSSHLPRDCSPVVGIRRRIQ